MTVYSFVNKKGGCGKSTLVCALSLYWAERAGKRVAVQDMEIDGGSSRFVAYIDHPNLTLYRPGETYDFVLIDTQGGADRDELAQVEALSDRVLIPLLLAPLDIAKAYETSQLLSDPANARLLINQVRTNTTAWKSRKDTLKAIPVKPLNHHVTRRTAYANLLIDGWGALNRPALDELEQLAWELS